MIEYPNFIEDQHVVHKFREIIDAINNIKPQVASTAAAIQAAPTFGQIQQALSVGGPNPLNVTGLPGQLAQGQGITSYGTHAARPLPQTKGALYFETDRESLYVTESTSGALAWNFVSGCFSAIRTSRPTDLGSNDAGFLFHIQDYAHLARWDGAAWRLTEGSGGYIVSSVAALGSGYQLCDGTTTDYILDNTSNLAVSSFTTPNLNGSAGTYLGAISAYTGTINAPVAPHFTGVLGNTSTESADTTVQSGAGATVAAQNHNHTFIPAGIIGLPGDPISNLGVIFFFRR